MLSINVNDHTEKKNGLTYLSWAWAWAKVLEIDPNATWEAVEFGGFPACFAPDDSALVKVTVTIKGHTKSCWLPVMDYKNKAIKSPDAFAINTAIVRCMTKCVGMFGLGLYIYAGEDLPPLDTQALDELAASLVQLHQEGNDIEAARLWYASSILADNDAREYMWSALTDYSALRSTIKANKPQPKAT